MRLRRPVARSVFHLGWSLVMFLGPIVVLVLLWDDRGSTSFVLTAIGEVIVLIGIIIVSNAVKTPHYKVMLAWDPEAMPPDWEAGHGSAATAQAVTCSFAAE